MSVLVDDVGTLAGAKISFDSERRAARGGGVSSTGEPTHFGDGADHYEAG